MHLYQSSTSGLPMSRRPRSIRLLSLLGAAVLLFTLQAGSRAETASADVCNPNGGGWLCHWEATLSPYQNRYFNAANPVRNWLSAGVGDQHGGAVAAKRVNVLNSGGTSAISVACGSGFPSNPVPANYRPGQLYIFHWASGARTITGAGAH
jgi:hypothetical protein